MPGNAVATGYVRLIPSFDGKLKSTITEQLGGVDSKGIGSKIGRNITKGTEGGLSGLKGAMSSKFSAASVAVGNIAANLVGKAMGAVSSSMDAAVKRMDVIENFPKVMESLGYSADVAANSIGSIKDHLDGLPSSTSDIASFVQQLAATQGDLDLATRSGLAFNDMMLAGGKSSEVVANAQSAYNKILAKGAPEMDNWMTLVETAPGQIQQLSDTLLGAGHNQADLYHALNKGEISIGEFNDAIVRLDSEGGEGFASFEAQARAATGGVGTAMENVKNRIAAALANIMQAIGQENISGVIDSISSTFTSLGAVIGKLNDDGSITGFIGGLKSSFDAAMDGWEPTFDIDVSGAIGSLQELASGIGEFVGGPIATFVQVTDENLSKIGETWDSIVGNMSLPEIDWGSASQGVSDLVAALGSFEGDFITTAMQTIADVGQRIGETVTPAIEKMQPGFDAVASAAESFVRPIADFLTGQGPAFDGMMERVNEHLDDLKPAMDDFAEAFNHLGEAFQPIAETLGPIVAEVMGNIGSALVGLLPILAEAAAGIMETVAGLLEAVTAIPGFFAGAVETIKGVWDGLVGFISSIPERIQQTFERVPAFLAKVFSSAKQVVTEKFEGIANSVMEIPGKIVGFFSGIGERIGNAIGSIHFPQPHVSWEDLKIGDFGIPIPHVSWYKTGAIFDANSPQVIGVGDASVPEAVTPIDKLKDYISDAVGTGREQVEIVLNYTDGSADAQQMMRDIAREYRRYNLAGAI